MVGINFAPEPIGIGKYTGEFVGSLVREGFDVSVVTAYPHYPWWRVRSASGRGYSTEESEGMTVIRCPIWVPSRPGGMGRMMQDLSFFITSWLAVSWLLLKGRRFEIVYTVVPSYPSAWIGAWVKWFRSNACWVIHVMDLQVDAAGKMGLIRSGWLLRCLAWSERRILCRADRVSTISDGMLRRITEKGVVQDRAILFPNWVDLSVFHPGLADEKVLSGLGLPVAGRMVLYSGAVGEKQCLEILPDVASRLQTAMPDIFFVIAGEGPYQHRLKLLAKDAGVRNIHFIRIQPEPVFSSLLRKAWLHLVLQRDTDSELFMPSKLGPIMASGGCALVTASPTSGLGRFVREYGVGEALHPASSEVLKDSILEKDRRPDIVRELGARAHSYAVRYLERDVVIRRYLCDLGFPVDTGPPIPG